MAVTATATAGENMKLKILPSTDAGVKDLIGRLDLTVETRAEMNSGNKFGIKCDLYHWGVCVVKIESGKHCTKIVPVKLFNSSSGMGPYLKLKQVPGGWKFLDAKLSLGIRPNGMVPKEMEGCYDEDLVDATTATLTIADRAGTEDYAFVSKCSVILTDLERYNIHTQEVHEMETDNFLQNVAGAAPVGVQNDTKDDIIHILTANGKNDYFGKNRPEQIPDKPSRRFMERYIADYMAYFLMCGKCDEQGIITKANFPAVWQELKDFSMFPEQLTDVIRAKKRDKNMPNDRYQPFAFKMSDLQAWMIDAVVDREDNWKKLEGIKNRKAQKSKSITDQFEECLEETEDFNDYLIGKVSKINEDN
jgi:hypothetical protein